MNFLPSKGHTIAHSLYSNWQNTLIEHTHTHTHNAKKLHNCYAQSNLILILHTPYSILQAAPKELLYPFIPQYIDTFAVLLNTASGQQGDDDDTGHVIHKEVISSLTTLLKAFPKMMTGHLATILQPIWNVVISSTNEYP